MAATFDLSPPRKHQPTCQQWKLIHCPCDSSSYLLQKVVSENSFHGMQSDEDCWGSTRHHFRACGSSSSASRETACLCFFDKSNWRVKGRMESICLLLGRCYGGSKEVVMAVAVDYQSLPRHSIIALVIIQTSRHTLIFRHCRR
jgi:hypothetical protein